MEYPPVMLLHGPEDMDLKLLKPASNELFQPAASPSLVHIPPLLAAGAETLRRSRWCSTALSGAPRCRVRAPERPVVRGVPRDGVAAVTTRLGTVTTAPSSSP